MPGSIKALRIRNLLLGGGITSAQLDTELAIPASLGAFNAGLTQRAVMSGLAASTGAMTVLANSSTAMTALLANSTAWVTAVASTTAMTAIAASSTAMTALLANSTAWATAVASTTAMTAIAASSTAMTAAAASSAAMTTAAVSSTAMTALMANTTARSAIYNSDTALVALANTTTRDILRGLAQYISKTISNAASTAAVSLALTGNAIIFEMALDNSGTFTLTGRRAGSTQGTITAYDPAATALPGDTNVVALTNSATVATSASATRSSLFGLIYV